LQKKWEVDLFMLTNEDIFLKLCSDMGIKTSSSDARIYFNDKITKLENQGCQRNRRKYEFLKQLAANFGETKQGD